MSTTTTHSTGNIISQFPLNLTSAFVSFSTRNIITLFSPISALQFRQTTTKQIPGELPSPIQSNHHRATTFHLHCNPLHQFPPSSLEPTYSPHSPNHNSNLHSLAIYFIFISPQPLLPSNTPSLISIKTTHSRLNLLSATSPDQSGGFFLIPSTSSGRNYQEENHLPSRFHAWERDHLPSLSLSQVDRDSSWRPYHQNVNRSDPSMRSSNFRLRHGSDRMPSQNR
ncbi:hypothetical protein RYX36_013373, partial [Vicia faba]